MARANLVLPNTFGTKVVKGPLSDLDANFSPLTNAFLDSGNGFGNFCTVAGTVNAIVLTSTPPALTLARGSTFSFYATGANTGAVTVNVDNLGFKSVLTANGAACVGGEIVGLCTLYFDGTKFYLASPFIANSAVTTANSAVSTANSAVTTANTALARSNTYGPRVGTGGGSANAQTVTNAPALTALANGTLVGWYAAAVNTGNVTLNVDGLGAHAIVSNIDGFQLTGGEIQGLCICYYVNGLWYLTSSGSPNRYRSIMRLSGSLVNPALNTQINFPVAPTFSRGNSGFVVSSNAVTSNRDGIMTLCLTADRGVAYMTLLVNTWMSVIQATTQPQCTVTVPLIANESAFIQMIAGTAANWTITGQAMVFA